MTTTDNLTRLRNMARAAMEHHHDIAAAANELARMLIMRRHRSLLIALIGEFLIKLPPAVPVGLKRKPSKVHGRRREGPHQRRATGASKRTKAGGVAAMKLVATEIFSRQIRGVGQLGNIHVNELRAIAKAQGNIAGRFVERGYDDGVEAIALGIMADNCQAADPFGKVRDVIPGHVAVEAFKEAQIRAAVIMRDASAKVAEDLIAAARKPPQLEPPRA